MMTIDEAVGVLNDAYRNSSDMAGLAWAIVSAHLSQPQPAAQGDAVACAEVVTDPSTGNRLVVTYFANGVTPEVGTKLYTIPTGHRVVPDGLEKDAARYQWLRDRLCVRWEMALDGEKHEALGMRPGFGFLRSTMDPAKGWTLPEFFDDHRQKTDNAIDKAMLAAAPDAGGV